MRALCSCGPGIITDTTASWSLSVYVHSDTMFVGAKVINHYRESAWCVWVQRSSRGRAPGVCGCKGHQEGEHLVCVGAKVINHYRESAWCVWVQRSSITIGRAPGVCGCVWVQRSSRGRAPGNVWCLLMCTLNEEAEYKRAWPGQSRVRLI